MSTLPLFPREDATPVITVHSTQKRHGVHYTPQELASFMARRSLRLLDREPEAVLDPACGDGELLLATAAEAQRLGKPVPALYGVDRDADALTEARKRLADLDAASVVLHEGDFLSESSTFASELPGVYDLVISNPPYVRTQVLGAARAKALGKQFGLSGRVDLYHAFVAAMTASLRERGVLGLLCSNRFLTTKGGNSLRSLLLQSYDIEELWDLGDTKMFEAAVLPVVAIGRRVRKPSKASAAFVRIYEAKLSQENSFVHNSLVEALESENQGGVAIGSRTFTIERGTLASPTAELPWNLTSPRTASWLAVVRQHASGRFGDLGAIRVGIKTTADTVFIRSDWDDLPLEIRPEPELLRPLLTHHVADRWSGLDEKDRPRSVLYPHEIRDGRRQIVALSSYPRAAAYLEQHRERLEGREYVQKAGRAWYEIWVPQQPDAWSAPKLVWPDISEAPKFFADETGAVVNGDCYWLTCRERTEGEIALALAVANSSFAVEYYDICCGNKLYAGRRRFITQYLEGLPMPEVTRAQQDDIVSMVRLLRDDADSRPEVETALDVIVFELFGLSPPAQAPA